MKRFIIIGALIFFAVSSGHSQAVKFGHINANELLQAMPEYDSAIAKLENLQKELNNTYELMTVEFNNKQDAFTKEEKNLTDLVKQTKQQDLADLMRRIQNFEVGAREQLQAKQAELIQPIQAKFEKALKDVAKENGFIYVFDIGVGVIPYYDETKSTNVMPLVKAKLGIK